MAARGARSPRIGLDGAAKRRLSKIRDGNPSITPEDFDKLPPILKHPGAPAAAVRKALENIKARERREDWRRRSS